MGKDRCGEGISVEYIGKLERVKDSVTEGAVCKGWGGNVK